MYVKSIYFLFIIFTLIFFIKPPKVFAAGEDLIISEYIEGLSNNKAIEIFNPTQNIISLSGYRLENHINGSLESSAFATSSATINSGETYVVCNSNSAVAILEVCDLKVSGVGTFATFNGNDAIVLSKGGMTVDSIGQSGFDPGTEWGIGLISSNDNTLRRKCVIAKGDSNSLDAFDPEVEWDGYETDNFDDLGHHLLCLSSSNPTGIPTSTPTTSPVAESTPLPTPTSTLSPTPSVIPLSTPYLTPTPYKSITPTISPRSTPTFKSDHLKNYHWVKKFIEDCRQFAHNQVQRWHDKDHESSKKWSSFNRFYKYSHHK